VEPIIATNNMPLHIIAAFYCILQTRLRPTGFEITDANSQLKSVGLVSADNPKPQTSQRRYAHRYDVNGKRSVEQLHMNTVLSVSERSPREWARLICKLRWMGMPEEAQALQQVVNTVPPEERASIFSEPFSTD
jgi:hypothetical protein